MISKSQNGNFIVGAHIGMAIILGFSAKGRSDLELVAPKPT